MSCDLFAYTATTTETLVINDEQRYYIYAYNAKSTTYLASQQRSFS